MTKENKYKYFIEVKDEESAKSTEELIKKLEELKRIVNIVQKTKFTIWGFENQQHQINQLNEKIKEIEGEYTPIRKNIEKVNTSKNEEYNTGLPGSSNTEEVLEDTIDILFKGFFKLLNKIVIVKTPEERQSEVDSLKATLSTMSSDFTQDIEALRACLNLFRLHF